MLLASQGQRLGQQQLTAYTRDLFEGLAALHERRVLLRDINISNLMLDAEGRLVIIDLGIALVSDPPATRELATWCSTCITVDLHNRR